jgi:regulator of RNase E activity RraA
MNSKIIGKPGFCITKEIQRQESNDVSLLGKYPVAILGDGYGRRAIMDSGIKSLNPVLKMCGSAITVETHPADNLMIHAALKLAQKGDILVINAFGNLSNGVFGGIMTQMALRKELGGVVLDGSIRDSRELAESGLPIYARGVNPMGGSKHGPGQINFPISCGGVTVNPGDAVVGDADGVIVIPKDNVKNAIASAQDKLEIEDKRIKAIKEGPIEGIYPKWLYPALIKQGILKEGEKL